MRPLWPTITTWVLTSAPFAAVPVEAGICASITLEVDFIIAAAVDLLSDTAAINSVAVEAMPDTAADEVTIAASPCVVAAPSPIRAAAKIDLEKRIFPDVLDCRKERSS